MDKDFNKCPICGIGSDVIKRVPNKRDIECTICGSYTVDINMYEKITTEENQHILSGYIRNKFEKGSQVFIEHDKIDSVIKGISVPSTPLEYIDEIILKIYQAVSKTNDAYKIDLMRDFPKFYCHDDDELIFILEKAKELNYIEEPFGRGYGTVDFRLTIKGWERAQNLRDNKIDSNKAFVAMWFNDAMKSVWLDGFYPILEDLGYDPIRVDKIEHNGKICDRIIAEINKSSLVIADFTGHRGGVYFEAGYAMGKGIPVIWTCKEADIKKAHFDTRQYNHISWESIDDLKVKLKSRIEATILNLPSVAKY